MAIWNMNFCVNWVSMHFKSTVKLKHKAFLGHIFCQNMCKVQLCPSPYQQFDMGERCYPGLGVHCWAYCCCMKLKFQMLQSSESSRFIAFLCVELLSTWDDECWSHRTIELEYLCFGKWLCVGTWMSVVQIICMFGYSMVLWYVVSIDT